MKNQVILYKKDQLDDQVLWSLTKAYCLVFNQKHYMIHQRSGQVIGIDAVFKKKKVSYGDLYSHNALESFLNEGYVFFHDPDTVFKRLKTKFFRRGNQPYVSLLLDPHKNVLGFSFGVAYPTLLNLAAEEGWLNRYHYSNMSQRFDIETWCKQLHRNDKLLCNIRAAMVNHKNLLEGVVNPIKQFRANDRFFSPNALGVLPDLQRSGMSSLLNESLLNALDAKVRHMPFLFETTVGDRIHRTLKQIGCVVADGTLADPDRKSQKKGDSVVMICNHSLLINGFLPLLSKKRTDRKAIRLCNQDSRTMPSMNNPSSIKEEYGQTIFYTRRRSHSGKNYRPRTGTGS